jgi:hypothetical protein
VFAGSDPLPVEEGSNSYGVAFTRESGDPHLPKVANVKAEISGAGPISLALSCATAGSAIYFTFDGSYPAESNTAAVLYTEPIEISTACTLLAVAEASDHLASNLLKASIEPT